MQFDKCSDSTSSDCSYNYSPENSCDYLISFENAFAEIEESCSSSIRGGQNPNNDFSQRRRRRSTTPDFQNNKYGNDETRQQFQRLPTEGNRNRDDFGCGGRHHNFTEEITDEEKEEDASTDCEEAQVIGIRKNSGEPTAKCRRIDIVPRDSYNIMVRGNYDQLGRNVNVVLEKYTIQDFVKNLRDKGYFTTFTKQWIQVEDADWITKKYIETIPEPSSSSSVMEKTTTMSSTIVSTPIHPVDVNSHAISKHPVVVLGGDILDELFPHSTMDSSTGSIQQSMAKRDGDVLITLKSPGEFGYRVVKLDVYDFKKICGKAKEHWWKSATYRSTFLTSSSVDPKEILVTKLLSAAASDLKKIPGVEKEAKVMKSYNSYNIDQHLQ